jgi:hypothetical protein
VTFEVKDREQLTFLAIHLFDSIIEFGKLSNAGKKSKFVKLHSTIV